MFSARPAFTMSMSLKVTPSMVVPIVFVPILQPTELL